MSKTVLVTGGTGSVGVSLVRRLLERGDTVYVLVRKPVSRLHEAVPGFEGRLFPLEGDVSLLDGGLSTEAVAKLRGKVNTIVHAAAIVQYHESMRDKMMEVNVQGTLNMLDLSARLDIPKFVYVSTAYVAGLREYFSEEDWGRPEDAQNPYEATKQLAEQAVANWRRAEVSILRLGTVVGDEGTGHTTGFGGFYGFVQSVWVYRERLLKYKKNPLLVKVNPNSTLNLVPSGWVIEAMLRLLDSSKLPENVFHLTNPQPVNMGWLFRETFHRVLRLPVVYDEGLVVPASSPEWASLNKAIGRHVKYFGHYVTDEPVFGFEHLPAFFPDLPPPPVVDEASVRVMLKFAEEHNFGRVAA